MPDALKELEARLNAAQQQLSTGKDQPGLQDDMSSGDKASFQRGMRIGCDLLAGVAVGVMLGLAVDKAFDTKPWGFIILFFLGSAAGMWNVFRAVTGNGYAVGFRHAGSRKDSPVVPVDDNAVDNKDA